MIVNEFDRQTHSYTTSIDDSTICSCVYESPSTEGCSVSERHILQLCDMEVDRVYRTVRLAAMLAVITMLGTLAWPVLPLRRYS